MHDPTPPKKKIDSGAYLTLREQIDRHEREHCLFRALVVLPDIFTYSKNDLTQDGYSWFATAKMRMVFFEAPTRSEPQFHLEQLLALTWRVNTEGWSEDGKFLIQSCAELLDAADPRELRLFALHDSYMDPDSIDLFVSPLYRGRLDMALCELTTLGTPT